MEFTKQQIKRLERLARIEKNPTLEIVDELSKVKDVLKKVKEKEVIFPEQREEISISNPEDIKNDIIDAIRQVKVIVEKYIASKMAVDAQKEAKMSKHTSEKEKSLGELKTAIIEAIQNLAENIPDSLDYSDQFTAILTELKKDNQKEVVNQLKELSKDIKDVSFPVELTEYDRVKVSLSSSQIKELGKAMSVSVSAGGGGFPQASQLDLSNISSNTGSGLIIPKWNSVYPTFNSNNDVWVFKLNGTTVSTVTITYTDTTKTVIQSVIQS